MGAEIDRLEIQVEAQAAKANAQLDNLIKKLQKVSGNLSNVNAGGLSAMANGVERLTKSMQSMNAVKTTDFTRLANNIQKMGNINATGLNTVASSVAAMSRTLSSMGAAAKSSENIAAMASGIGKLGGAGIQKAIVNLPALSRELKNLMTTLSQTPNVSKNVIQMTNALANLAASGSKVGSAANGISKNLRSVDKSSTQSSGALRKLSNSLGTLSAQSAKAKNSTKSLTSSFGMFYANCFLVIRGVKKLGSAIQKSMDYIETYNYFNVITDKIGTEFGDTWKKNGYSNAEDYADSFRERLNNLTTQMTGFKIGEEGGLYSSDSIGLGLDPEQIMSYQANIGSITNAVGLVGETSINTSKALTMLAADLSSLKNQDLESVMKNLQSGIIGQSRALYKYGIDITNNTLQTYAYAHGIEKAVSAMTQAEKMQLRVLAVLDQSKVAWGDMANTINGVANQYRIFKQQMSNLARIIGNLFIPVLQAVLPYINGFIIALQRLFTWVGNLLGVKWENLMDGISSGYTDTGLEELAENADDVTGALEDANKEANKLKKTIHSYDELHVATDPDSGKEDTAIGGSGGIDLSGAIEDALADYEKVWNDALSKMENKAKEIADKISSYFKKIYDAWVKDANMSFIGEDIGKALNDLLYSIDWDAIKEIAYKLGKSLSTALSGFLRTTDWHEVGTAIAESLNTLVQFWKGAIENFDFEALGLAFANVVNGFFENFDFAALAQSINKLVQGLFKALTTAIANIDWLTVYDGIITFLENLEIETVGIIIGALVIKGIGKAILGGTALKSFSTIFSSIEIWSSGGLVESAGLLTKLGDAIALCAGEAGTLHEAFVATFGTIGTIFTGIASIIGGVILAVGNFFSMWENGFSWLKEALMVIGTAIAAVGAVILGVPAGIAAIVAAVVAAVATAAIVIHDNWDAICEWFSGIPEWFNTNVVTPVCDFFKGLWKTVSGFFSGLWEDISAIWGSVSEWFSTNVIEPTVGFFQGFFTRVQQIFEGLWIIVQAVWVTVSDWFNENVIIPVVGFFQGLWDSVSEFFSSLWTDICEIWSTVSEWFNTNVIVPVVGFFQGLWKSVSGFFSQLWEDIKGIWSAVSDWFNTTVITPVVNAFTLFKDTIVSIFDRIWTSIKSGVVSAMNTVISAIESAINWIVGGINKIIMGFNSVVSWAASIIGQDWGGVSLVSEVHFSRIAMYESGGFPNTGELFMARENGISEMVGSIGNRPAVANNDQITEGIERAVTNAMMNVFMATQGSESSDDKEVHVHVHFGNDELGVAAFRGLKEAGSRGLIPKIV